MTLREKIIRQCSFFSLLISVILTAMVFNQSDTTDDVAEEAPEAS